MIGVCSKESWRSTGGSNPFWGNIMILMFLCFLWYSKASRYTASRSADLGDTRFLIGSQNTWDTRILAKSLEDTFFYFLVKKIMPINNFWKYAQVNTAPLKEPRTRWNFWIYWLMTTKNSHSTGMFFICQKKSFFYINRLFY